jgi:hypothetical protein
MLEFPGAICVNLCPVCGNIERGAELRSREEKTIATRLCSLGALGFLAFLAQFPIPLRLSEGRSIRCGFEAVTIAQTSGVVGLRGKVIAVVQMKHP